MIYLDYAGLGIPREDALRQEYEYKIALSKDPSLEFKYIDIIERNKSYLGSNIFHTTDYIVSYTRNTTEGLTIASNVVPLTEGDEVVTSSVEHRAADNSWEYICRKRKAKLIRVEIGPHDTKEEIIEKYKKVVSPRTKVIFCSHIDRNFGIIFPVTELSALAEQVGAYMIVDGAQAVGLIDVNVADLNCSIYVCSFHKWCRMPMAMGAMLVKKNIAKSLGRLYVGEERLEDEKVEDRDFGTDELGTRNVALEMCIPLLFDDISTEQSDNGVFDYFLQKLQSIPDIVEVVSYIHNKGRGFIVVDMIDNNDNLKDVLFSTYGIMIGRIKKNGKFYLRFSFDTFTQRNEIHILVEALKDIARLH